MRNCTALIVASLLGFASSGCSKHSPTPTSPTLSKATDLGIVEVSDKTPIQRSLGGNRACVITPSVFTDGSVMLSIAIVETNADGMVQTLATPRVQIMAGRTVQVSVGDIAIRLTPQIKH